MTAPPSINLINPTDYSIFEFKKIIQLCARPYNFIPVFTYPITPETMPPITPIENKAVAISLRSYFDAMQGKNTLPPMNIDVLREIASLHDGVSLGQLSPYKILQAHLANNFLSCYEFLRTTPSRVSARNVIEKYNMLSAIFEILDNYIVSFEPNDSTYEYCRESVSNLILLLKNMFEVKPGKPSESMISRMGKDIIEKLLLLEACLNNKDGLFLLLISAIDSPNKTYKKTAYEIFLDAYEKQVNHHQQTFLNSIKVFEQQLVIVRAPSELRKYFADSLLSIKDMLASIAEGRDRHIKDYKSALNKLEVSFLNGTLALANLEENVKNLTSQPSLIKACFQKLVDYYIDYRKVIDRLSAVFDSEDVKVYYDRCTTDVNFTQIKKLILAMGSQINELVQKYNSQIKQSFNTLNQVSKYIYSVFNFFAQQEQCLLERYREIKILYPTEYNGIQFLDLVILNCRERISSLECMPELKKRVLHFFEKGFNTVINHYYLNYEQRVQFFQLIRLLISEWEQEQIIPPESALAINDEILFLEKILNSNSRIFLELPCGNRSKITFDDIKIFKSLVFQNLRYSVVDIVQEVFPVILEAVELHKWPSPFKKLVDSFTKEIVSTYLQSLAWQEELGLIEECKDPAQIVVCYAKLNDMIDRALYFSSISEYAAEITEKIKDNPEYESVLEKIGDLNLVIIKYETYDRNRNRAILEAAEYIKEARRAADAAAAAINYTELQYYEEKDTISDSAVESSVTVQIPISPISIDQAFNGLTALLFFLKNKRGAHFIEIKDAALMQEALSNILEGYLPSIRELLFTAECPFKKYGQIAASEMLTKLALCIEQAQRYAATSRSLSLDLPCHDLEEHQRALDMNLKEEHSALIACLNGFSHSRRLSSNYLLSEQGLALLKETRREVFENLANQVLQLTASLLTGDTLRHLEEKLNESLPKTRQEILLGAETSIMLIREIRSLFMQRRLAHNTSKSDRCIFIASNTVKKAIWTLESLLEKPLDLDHSILFANAALLNTALAVEQMLIVGIATFDRDLLSERIHDRQLRYCHNTEILLRSFKKCYAQDLNLSEEEVVPLFQSVIGHLSRYVSHCKNESISRLLEELRFMSEVRERIRADGFLTPSQHERFARDYNSSLETLEEKMKQIIKGDILVLTQRALQFCQSLMQKLS